MGAGDPGSVPHAYASSARAVSSVRAWLKFSEPEYKQAVVVTVSGLHKHLQVLVPLLRAQLLSFQWAFDFNGHQDLQNTVSSPSARSPGCSDTLLPARGTVSETWKVTASYLGPVVFQCSFFLFLFSCGHAVLTSHWKDFTVAFVLASFSDL